MKSLLGDAFEALKSGDEAKASSCYAAMVIPDPTSWFSRGFGDAEGARLATKYASLQSPANDWIRKRFELAVQNDRTTPEITVYQGPVGSEQPILHDVAAAMVEPFPIYGVRTKSGREDDLRSSYLGKFVYVEGAFRLVDGQVWTAMSAVHPPMRIRIGGNVQRARLINQVNPVYPESARQNKVEGTVGLHVVLGRDGSVQQVEVISGPPELQQAALDAVKQWKYQPTLLNGAPVEIDTQANVTFSLR